jgi:enoyl-CoA hydratase/carnithine racemase
MEQLRERIEVKVGVIELFNPPHNFMNAIMIRELDRLTLTWEKNPNISAIVITGGIEDIFITHYSVEEIVALLSPLQNISRALKGLTKLIIWLLWWSYGFIEHVPMIMSVFERVLMVTMFKGIVNLRGIHRVFTRLRYMQKPVIAAINGEALGGGCELAISCDYRIMARGDYRIGLIEALLGIIPGAGGNINLSRLIGPGKAVEMIMDGTFVDPDQAQKIGLITKVVEKKDLMVESLELARRLSTRSTTSVRGIKRAVRSGICPLRRRGMWFEKSLFIDCGFSGSAQKEGEIYLQYLKTGMRAREIYDIMRKSGDV